ncbi:MULTISPECIES: bacteriophage abortive infection AbiH family protein [unclassified Clostridium]|uniref:bacteriophage abortive infection AbiH family protein n=1 Tax=unclassified Clostridium TaxID=2614128 RepID=UPI00207A7A11|nr:MULTISPECIES: bacteriophage abortive infection AbiH family protein [unclassified Clostridium]
MNLVITGNGFDIAHGINSRYSDFYNYLASFESEPRPMFPEFPEFLDRNSISNEDLKKHELIERLEKYIPSEDLWSCFEEALGTLDYEQLQEDNSSYLIGYGDDDWRDSANHDYQYMIQEELNFTNDIDYQFKRWIGILNTMVQPLQSIIEIFNICKYSQTLFLNFNYTDTLERTYGIERNSILYIHGKVGESMKLILGHHDDFFWNRKSDDVSQMTEEEYEHYCEYLQERDVREVEAESIIKAFFKTTYKDTIKIIEQNKMFFLQQNAWRRVFVLGHSLSEIDFDYFREIRKNTLQSCEWFISAYSSDDINRALQFVDILQIQLYKIIKL